MPSTADEQWLPVVGSETTHEVSDAGRVRSGGALCDLNVEQRTGYQYLSIASKNRRVHRLVLEAFRGPCPPGMESLHDNGVPADNRLGNLRWGTHQENCADLVRHGTHHNVRKTTCPRDHLLEAPNVPPAARREGRRFCYACFKATKTSFVRAAISPEEREARMRVESDRQYARILAAADVPWQRQAPGLCKRGHRRAAPNLGATPTASGSYPCLACRRAVNSWDRFAAHNPGHDRERWLQERSDANYAALMAGT